MVTINFHQVKKKIMSILTRTMMTTTSLRKAVIHHSVTPLCTPSSPSGARPQSQSVKNRNKIFYLCPVEKGARFFVSVLHFVKNTQYNQALSIPVIIVSRDGGVHTNKLNFLAEVISMELSVFVLKTF